MLVDPVHAGRSVSEIGARWGLPDAPHFSRVFKTAYGVSPRQFRSAENLSELQVALGSRLSRVRPG